MRILAAILAGAAALAVATGCGTAPPAEPTTTDLTATDLAFLDLVIPQNESALAAIALAAGKPGSTLRQVEAGYREELVQAEELLAKAGRQESDQHDGHDMPGMITAAELKAIEDAQGTDFDRQLKALLRTQFEEARTVARAELSSGTSKPVLELASRIDRTRAEFSALLDAS
ncbi:DUF305 domain-containing protein [Lentzea sp. NPDC051213]|uniref:DUF305 domain-containing protein n=1 Tax=Lentzea sp. NPDC051213 TaxID=3364126 RepID=UPI0037AAEEEE